MGKRMYRNHEKNKDGSPYYSNFKTINGRVVNVGKHHQKDMAHHVTAHDMEPRLKKSDGRHDYDIIRFYKDPNKNSKIIRYGVTEREAVRHTNNPTTSTTRYFDGMQRRY